MPDNTKGLPKPPLPAGVGRAMPGPAPGISRPPAPSPVGGMKPSGALPLGAPKPIAPLRPQTAVPPARPPVAGVPQPGARLGDELKDVELAHRIQEMERRSEEISEGKTLMEKQVRELEQKLQEEKEKVLLASLRSREEAALASKVEIALKEMQERLRRDRQAQNLDESRQVSEEKVKELERRLTEERQTWMQTLKDQLATRENQDHDIEEYLSQRVSELEERWREEKENLLAQLKDREARYIRQRQEGLLSVEKLKKEYEAKLHRLNFFLTNKNTELTHSLRKLLDDKRLLTGQLEEAEKALLKARAQISLLQSQMGMEKEKAQSVWQRQLDQQLQDFRALQLRAEQLEKDNTALSTKVDELNAAHREQIAGHQRQQEALQQAFERERVDLCARQRDEQELWKRGLTEFESRLVKEKLQWERELESHKKAWALEREMLVREKERLQGSTAGHAEQLAAQRRAIEREMGELKTQRILGESEAHESLGKKEAAFKHLEEKYWQERAALAVAIEGKDQEIRQLQQQYHGAQETLGQERERAAKEYKTVEARYWEEKEKNIALLRAKEEEIAGLTVKLYATEIRVKEKMEQEFRDLVAAIERENKEWIDRLSAQTEETNSLRIGMLQKELAGIKEALEGELGELETRLASDKQQVQVRLDEKEKQLAIARVELQGIQRELTQERSQREQGAARLLQENSILRAQLDRKEKDLERFSTDVYQREMNALRTQLETQFQNERSRWESVLTQKEHELAQVRTQLREEEAASRKHVEDLQRRFHEELAIIESRFRRQSEEGRGSVIGHIWRYLNRTVIIVNFSPSRWLRRGQDHKNNE